MNGWHTESRRQCSAETFRRRMVAVFGGIVALMTALTLLAPPVFAWGKTRPQADFNGDGYADLAIGVPGEDYTYGKDAITDAGVVHVVYGGKSGLAYGANGLLTRATEYSANPHHPASYQRLGASLAWGDFNKDGYDDLAVGVPGDQLFGSVDIYFGKPSGLAFPGQRITLDQIPGGLPNFPGNTFGGVLAAGDIDNDGYCDLAISQLTSQSGRGAVYIIRGNGGGLKPESTQGLFYFSWMGPASMVMGDFNGDGCDDLAMGMPYQWKGNVYYAGVVLVVHGSLYGIDPNAWVFDQETPGLEGRCEDGDQFGWALTAADFNDDGSCDLAIGSPGENKDAGIVNILWGKKGNGLTTEGCQTWSQGNGVPGVPESGDRFGASLAAIQQEPQKFASPVATGSARISGIQPPVAQLSDRFPELVVGVPGENSGSGVVNIITVVPGQYGVNHTIWSQDSTEILGACEAGDRFGSSLAVGDFNGNGYPDLAVGVGGENSVGGAVNIIFGGGKSLTWSNNQLLMQGYQGLPEVQEDGDYFGQL